MNPYEIIIQPVDTEKTRFQSSELGKYSFEVNPSANKIEIKKAIEEIFDVDVKSVNVMIVPGKFGGGRGLGMRRPPWKKAVVTLAEGQRLDLFEGV